MNDLVQLENNHAFTTSLIIAKGVGTEHRAVMQLIDTHVDDIKDLSFSAFEMRKRKAKGQGKPTRYAVLNELQATFLITLMKNSKVVIQFKKSLTVEFFRMAKELARIASNQNNEQWLEQRNTGKEVRLIETDSIKKFIEYATAQGSKSAKMYYMNITKMENKALFIVEQKYPNLRDVLGIVDLSTIQKADLIVSRALEHGMSQDMQYKDIYKLAKERIELFADLIGKSQISQLLVSQL